MTKKEEKCLAELHRQIKKEVRFINIIPYGHNIISCILRTICKEFGYNKANAAIDKFELDEYGYEFEQETETNNSKVRSSKMNGRNHKNWTATDLTKLTRMYSSGRLSIAQIADRLGRTYHATAKKAERMHLPRPLYKKMK